MQELQQEQIEKLEDVFNYHAPSGGDLRAYNRIRSAAKNLAYVILEEAPVSADRTAALRKVREAMMIANASIALKGKSL